MSDCAHEAFTGHVAVNRLLATGRFSADISVNCSQCGESFRWRVKGWVATDPRFLRGGRHRRPA